MFILIKCPSHLNVPTNVRMNFHIIVHINVLKNCHMNVLNVHMNVDIYAHMNIYMKM